MPAAPAPAAVSHPAAAHRAAAGRLRAALDAAAGLLRPGLNYVVQARVEAVPPDPGASAASLVRAALGGGAVIGGVRPATAAAVVAAVEGGLRYPGGVGHGPEPGVLHSPAFRGEVAAAAAAAADLAAGAELIWEVWFAAGRPCEDVFWGFAFVLCGPGGGAVVVAGSSD